MNEIKVVIWAIPWIFTMNFQVMNTNVCSFVLFILQLNNVHCLPLSSRSPTGLVPLLLLGSVSSVPVTIVFESSTSSEESSRQRS